MKTLTPTVKLVASAALVLVTACSDSSDSKDKGKGGIALKTRPTACGRVSPALAGYWVREGVEYENKGQNPEKDKELEKNNGDDVSLMRFCDQEVETISSNPRNNRKTISGASFQKVYYSNVQYSFVGGNISVSGGQFAVRFPQENQLAMVIPAHEERPAIVVKYKRTESTQFDELYKDFERDFASYSLSLQAKEASMSFGPIDGEGDEGRDRVGAKLHRASCQYERQQKRVSFSFNEHTSEGREKAPKHNGPSLWISINVDPTKTEETVPAKTAYLSGMTAGETSEERKSFWFEDKFKETCTGGLTRKGDRVELNLSCGSNELGHIEAQATCTPASYEYEETPKTAKN